jgi:ankyrin repeat protein
MDSESADGWNLSSTEPSSSDVDEPVSDGSRSPPEREPDLKPESGVEDFGNTINESAKPVSLRELLNAFLDKNDVSAQSSLAGFRLTNLSKSICGQSYIDNWISSERNERFLLSLPAGLNHPFFFSSLTERLGEVHTEQHLTKVVIANRGRASSCATGEKDKEEKGMNAIEESTNTDETPAPDLKPEEPADGIVPVQRRPEHLLASICFQILLDPDLDNFNTELYDDLRLSFQGTNHEWRETVLWALLQLLLTSDRRHTRRIVAVCFCGDASPSTDEISIVKRLTCFISGTGRHLKLLIILPNHTALDLDKHFPWKEDLKDADTADPLFEEIPFWADAARQMTHFSLKLDPEATDIKMALFDDIQSWVDDVTTARPPLMAVKDRILSNIDSHYNDPLLIVCYLRHLESCLWITQQQLKDDEELLSAPEHFIRSIMDIVPRAHGSFVGNALAVAFHASRTLTTTELTTALAVEGTEVHSNAIDQKALLDIEYDLHHSLPGLIHVEEKFIRLSHHSLKTILDGTTAPPPPSWIIPIPQADMKLAYICLRYIAIWTNCQQGQKIDSDNTSVDEWPLLDYAVRFWHVHYQQAMEKGVKDDQIRPFVENWDVVKSWITLWSYIQPWGTSEQEPSAKLCPTEIAAKFKISIPIAINVSLLATQILPLTDDDYDFAALWAVWQLDSNTAHQMPWIEKLKDSSILSPLLGVFPRAPLETFRQLDAANSVNAENAGIMLSSAVRQGVTTVAESCFDMITLNVAVAAELPWFSCARYGYNSLLKKLFSMWPSIIQTRNSRGCTALHEAVRQGQLETVDLLLGYGIEFDAVDENGESAVILASRNGFVKILWSLLKKHPNTALRDSSKFTALHHASIMGYRNIAKLLIDEHAPIIATDGSGNTPLHLAVQNNHIELVELFLQPRKSGTSQASLPGTNNIGDHALEKEAIEENGNGILEMFNFDGLGENPLKEAINYGHEDIALLLLGHYTTSTLNTKYILHAAAGMGRVMLVKYLVKLDGIDIDQPDSKQRTALQFATYRGHVAVVEFLMDNGADSLTRDQWGDTPLDDALARRNEDLVKALLKQQPEKSILGNLLYSAARRGLGAILTMLLDAGADKDYEYDYGSPALRAAVCNDEVECVRILLMRQVKLDGKDSSGDTVLSDASAVSDLTVIRMLLDAGVSMDTKNATGRTPLQKAAINNRSEVVQFYLERGAILEADPSYPGSSLLEQLVKKQSFETVKVVVNYEGDRLDSTLLAECFHIALRNDDPRIVSLLLDKGADANAMSAKALYGTALQECAYYCNLKMAKVLLERPVPVKVNEIGGRFHTALIASVCMQEESRRLRSRSSKIRRKASEKRFERRRRMMEYLLEKKADPTISGGKYGTVVNASAVCAPERLLRHVLDKTKLPVTFKDHEGRSTAHMVGMAYDHTGKLEMLLKRGGPALMREADLQGRTPLHFACAHGALPVMKFFLDLGEDGQINTPDKDGWTPLHWACRQWDILAVSLLLNRGANPEARTNENWTPWHVAVFHNNEEFEDILQGEKFRAKEDLLTKPGLRLSASCDSCHVVSTSSFSLHSPIPMAM